MKKLTDQELQELLTWGRAKAALGWNIKRSIPYINVATGQKFRKRTKSMVDHQKIETINLAIKNIKRGE